MTKMEQFFTKSGEFIGYKLVTSGAFPHRTFVSVFTYENGHASYDGRDWVFVIN